MVKHELVETGTAILVLTRRNWRTTRQERVCVRVCWLGNNLRPWRGVWRSQKSSQCISIYVRNAISGAR